MAFLYIILFVAFFVPGFMIPDLLAKVWPTDILLLLILFKRILLPPTPDPLYVHIYRRRILLPYVAMLLWLSLITIIMLPMFKGYQILVIITSLMGRFRPLLFIWFIMPYLDRKDRIHKFGRFMLFVGSLELFILFLQRLGLFGINSWYTPKFRSVDIDISYIYSLGVRTIGSIGNPNDVGTFLTIIGALAFCFYLFGQGIRKWFGLGMWGTAIVACVFLTQSRQGTLSLLFASVIAAFFAMRYMKISRLSLMVVMLFIAIPIFVGYLLSNPALAERFGILLGRHGFTEESSIQGRLAIWPEFFSTYGGHAIFGQGMGAFLVSITWDSGWLMTLVAGGIPMVMLYIWWCVATPLTSMRYMRLTHGQSQYAIYHVTAISVVLPMWVTNLVNNSFNNTIIMLTWSCVFALSLAGITQDQYLLEDLATEDKSQPEVTTA